LRLAVKRLIVAVVVGILLISILDGARRRRSIQDRKMLRYRAVAAEAKANEIESTSDRVIKLLSYPEKRAVIEDEILPARAPALITLEDLARQHDEEVRSLDGLLHPYEEINGRVCCVLFTEDYYREPEKHRERWQRLRDWHAQMAEKYRRAALHPEEPVSPDPPEPK
jgi:hypothetical protein